MESKIEMLLLDLLQSDSVLLKQLIRKEITPDEYRMTTDTNVKLYVKKIAKIVMDGLDDALKGAYGQTN